MCSLNQIKNRIRRIIASLLAIVLLITGIPVSVFAEEVYSDYLGGWKVQCTWSTLSQDYEWNAKGDEIRQPKIVVTYRMDHADKAYPAGSLQFTVPGIGNATRANVIKADKVAADAQDSEWAYTWDSHSDTYTFTNKFAVQLGESVSGGFELLWSLKARNCTNGFEQKKSPVFTLVEEGAEGETESITMKPLSYRFTSVRDRYRIVMSGNPLTPDEYAPEDEDYAWYNIKTSFENDWFARGLYKSNYYVWVDLPAGAEPEDVKIIYEDRIIDLTVDPEGRYGFYPFENDYGDIGTQQSHYENSVHVGILKEKLIDEQITVHGHLDRLYQDESEWVHEAGEYETVDASFTFTVADYGFVYAGHTYKIVKRSDYETIKSEAPADYSDRLNAVNLYNGKVVQFHLYGSAFREYDPWRTKRGGMATPSNASDISVATPSDAVDFREQEIPEGIDDWNDIHWRDNRQPEELEDAGRATYGEIHPEFGTATPSDAMEDEDGEVLVPDITFFGRGIEKVKSLFEIQAYAAETATPSDASESKPGGETPEQPSMGADDTYALVLGDDKLAIFLADGSIRNLEDSEYDITHLTVPSDDRDYDYEVYGASTQDTAFPDYKIMGTGNTRRNKTIRLPEGVKAVYISVNNIVGSYYINVDVGVRLHLDWAYQQTLPEAERPSHENRLVNFSYLRSLFYNNDEKKEINVCQPSEHSYLGDYGEILKERDNTTYGEYLLRDYANVWLRSPVTELSSKTMLDEFAGNGAEGYTSRVQTSGTIQADNSGTLERFSLYTVLPDGLQADLDNTEILIEGAGTDIFGEAVTNQDFASHVSFGTGEHNGKRLLRADFDFSDAPLEAGQLTTASIRFPVTLSAADFVSCGNYYTVNSYLMVHDDGLDRISGRAIMTDAYDIDGDGMTTEQMAYSGSGKRVDAGVIEWREFVSKYVKTAFSNGSYVMDAVTKRYVEGEAESEQAKSGYSYRLDFGLGSSNAKNIQFFDRIEQGASIADHKSRQGGSTDIPSEWQGQFLSVDTSFAQELGMIPTVYYSDNPDQEFDLNAEGWTTEAGESVKAIAVVLDTSGLEDGMMKMKQMVYVTVNMRAPAEESLIGKRAVNQYEVQYEGYDLNDGEEKVYTLPSAATYVRLLDSAGKLVLQKVDADHVIGTDADGNPIYATLTGATFQIYNSKMESLFDPPKELNALGRIEVSNVPNGTYYWQEITPPIGYEKDDRIYEIQVDGMQGIIQIENKRIPGSVILTKYDADSASDAKQNTLSGAVFELYRANGEKIYTSGADGDYVYAEAGAASLLETGHDGTLCVSSLPWGKYYFVEIQAPEGYETDGTQIPFRIGQENITEENEPVPVEVKAENSQLPASVLLVKKDAKDGAALKDAYYDLYKKNAEGDWIKSQESLKTNAAGELIVEGLKFGEYQFVEVQPPRGYELNPEPVGFVLDASTVGTMAEIEHKDERKTGSAVLTKWSEDGIPLKDAVFALYKDMGTGAEAQVIEPELRTDENGQTETVTGLLWGKYYFLETAAPEGYELSRDPVRFFVDAEHAEAGVQVSAKNMRIRGSVVLTKLDEETKEKRLGGAVFNLYRQDGTLVRKDLTTKTDEETGGAETGTVRVDNLDWGSYYFEETKAPAGYGLYPGKIRFSVNSQNSSAVQQLTCYDPVEQVQITIHKEINEQFLPFGVPTFLFKITGTDVSGAPHEWIKSLTLDGVTEGTVVLSGIPAGEYTITEMGVERYQLVEVRPGSNVALNEDGKSATAILSAQDETKKEAEVTFVNQMTQYEKYSHVTGAANLVNATRKVTAFEVTYRGPEVIESDTESEYTFGVKDIKAVLHYDDGTMEVVDFSDLELNPATITGDLNTGGSGYTVLVTHTVDDGTEYTDTFSVEIKLQKPKVPYAILYDANDGYFETDAGDRFTNELRYRWNVKTSKNECLSGVYAEPEHRAMLFDGWYTEKTCQPKDRFIPELYLLTELTGDIRVYAKWKEAEAVFDTGENVKQAMKELAEMTPQNIKAVHRSPIQPDLSDPAKVRNVSHDKDTKAPIYMWFDKGAGVVYWWSKDETPEMNRESNSMFGGLNALKDISGLQTWKADNVADMRGMFDGCRSLSTQTTITALSGWNVSRVTDMSFMFTGCSSLESLEALRAWDVSSVENMQYMFRNCKNLKSLEYLKLWEVNKVTRMEAMFGNCEKLTNLTGLENWEVSEVTRMEGTFKGCILLEDLAGIKDWIFTKTYDMGSMFEGCIALTDLVDIGNWEFPKVTNMANMFFGCVGLTSLEDIRNWDVSNVEIMYQMFRACVLLVDASPIMGWNVINVTDFGFGLMFYNCAPDITLPIFIMRPGEWKPDGTYSPYA